VALARKTKAVNTLQEELNRTEGVRDRLEEMVEGMTVPLGETTVGHLRSASWYGNQVQDQLKTISNRAEFLSEEVASHRRDAARVRHQHNLAAEKGDAHDRRQRDLREEKAESALPPRPSVKR
jgi:chromosome segregation ATPase